MISGEEEKSRTSCGVKLMDDMTRTALGPIEMEKLPISSVDTPLLPPLTWTDALGTGVPWLSVTLPVTVRFCAHICVHSSIRPHNNESFLISFCDLVVI